MQKKSSKKLCNLVIDETLLDSHLSKIKVGDIWGIGKKFCRRLKDIAIITAFDLKKADNKIIRKKFNIFLEKTLFELRGLSCMPLEKVTSKKSITVSRSFGKDITDRYSIN